MDLSHIGRYYCQEVSSGSKNYLLNDEVYHFKIRNDGEIIEKTYTNEPIEIKVDIEKTGDVETKPDKVVDYTFSNICSNSNTDLEIFRWFEYIPTSAVRIETMTTGTFNQNKNYDVYYRTNKNNDYALFRENLNTSENYNLNFKDISLYEGEYITEVYFNFGEVEKGFKEVEKPTMQCRTLSTVSEGQIFTNKTVVEGIYGELESKVEDKWTTIVPIPEEPTPTLPDTGK